VDKLPVEVERYRYRILIERGTRGRNGVENSRKREREVIAEERQNKRQREDVIELSSDGDEPPLARVRRMNPVNVDSSTSDEDTGYEDDFDATLVEDDILLVEGTSAAVGNDTLRGSSGTSSGTTRSMEKGKEKQVIVEPILDIQEELECFICCIVPSDFADNSDVTSCAVRLFTLWSRCLWALQYVTSDDLTNLVYKWREKSNTCPQCRIKLSSAEPFLRDYVLERIAEKFAKLNLSPEELLEREVLAAYLPTSPF
jgi:hypothetical protein